MEDKGTLWLPVDASTMAGEIDSLFYFTYYVSIAIFVAVIVAMVYFVIKYRRKHANERTERVHESKILELTWIVVPTILCMVVFTWGFHEPSDCELLQREHMEDVPMTEIGVLGDVALG